MTTSTTAHKTKGAIRLWAVAFWLAVWQLSAMALGQKLLLPPPLEVAACLARLAATSGFWLAVGRSAGQILGGFFIACALAALLAGLSARFCRVRELLAPLLATVKAVPVVSFIILALVWVSPRHLSLLIAALMAFPTVYLNLLTGIDRTDVQLLEMARVFQVPFFRQLRGIYIPQVLPWFRSACSLGMGLSWKAGVAAEVIGLPAGFLGERLYTAKIYLETPELFAWTASIVAASVAFEKLFLWALDALSTKGARA